MFWEDVSAYDCLVFQESVFIEEGNFVEERIFRRLRRLAMLKIWTPEDLLFCCMPSFVLEMFTGLNVLLCCKGLVLTMRWRNVLVYLRMFAAKIVVPFLMLSSLIYDWGIRIKGSRRFVPGKKRFSSLCFCEESALRDFISCIFKDDSYSCRLLCYECFLTCCVLQVKRCRLKVNCETLSVIDKFSFSVNCLVVRTQLCYRKIYRIISALGYTTNSLCNRHLAFYDKSWIVLMPIKWLERWSLNYYGLDEDCVQQYSQGRCW